MEQREEYANGVEMTPDLERRFEEATVYIPRIIADLNATKKLLLYGLYKQAIVGPVNIDRPSIWHTEARRKWDAWKAVETMSKVTAMHFYVRHLTDIAPDWDAGSEQPRRMYWASVSTLMPDPIEMTSGPNDTLIDYIKDNNAVEIRVRLATSRPLEDRIALVNTCDEEGVYPIHWAADRGNLDIVDVLLENGANVNQKDNETGQTALHYATSCGHHPCVKILLEYNADRDIRDHQMSTSLDLAIEWREHDIAELLRNYFPNV